MPGALIAVLGAMIAGYAGNLGTHGVVLLGPCRAGCRSSGAAGELSWEALQDILVIAFAMFIVILAQSAATSRAYGRVTARL